MVRTTQMLMEAEVTLAKALQIALQTYAMLLEPQKLRPHVLLSTRRLMPGQRRLTACLRMLERNTAWDGDLFRPSSAGCLKSTRAQNQVWKRHAR